MVVKSEFLWLPALELAFYIFMFQKIKWILKHFGGEQSVLILFFLLLELSEIFFPPCEYAIKWQLFWTVSSTTIQVLTKAFQIKTDRSRNNDIIRTSGLFQLSPPQKKRNLYKSRKSIIFFWRIIFLFLVLFKCMENHFTEEHYLVCLVVECYYILCWHY